MAQSWMNLAKAVVVLLLAVVLQSETVVAETNDCSAYTTKSTCRAKKSAYDCYWKSKKCQQRPNVYFVGNSFTIYRVPSPKTSLPDLVQKLANKASSDVGTWTVDSYATGSAQLRQTVADSDVTDEIFARNRTWLVLQEQSQMLAYNSWTSTTLPAAKKFAQMAAEKGMQVMLYETWGYGSNYDSFQSALHTNYQSLADEIGATLCPAGQVWKKAREELGSDYTSLYGSDSKHPSYFGHYVVACAFHACIHGESPVGLAYYPYGVTEAQAALAQQWAADVILSR